MENGEHGKWLLLILVVMRNFGAADAASDNARKRKGKLEESRWEREMTRNSWADKEDRRKFREQERTENKSEVQKPTKKK